MSKRTPRQTFSAHDFVETPEEGVIPLAMYLPCGATYYEPCAGNGALIRALDRHAIVECTGASDINGCMGTPALNALTLKDEDLNGADYLITNPPWRTELLHPLIDHLVPLRPTWLLLYSDWLFTKQAVPYHKFIWHILTMPRVRWIRGTKTSGFENCCWVLFCDAYENDEADFIKSGWTK